MRLRMNYCAAIITLLMIIVTSTAYAGDPFAYIHRGIQHSLPLGTVVSVSGDTLEFEPSTIISGDSLPSTILIKIPDRIKRIMKRREMPDLKSGDFAVISLNTLGDIYYVAWGLFIVSSINPDSLEVLDGTFSREEQAAMQWFVRSGGKENYFVYKGSKFERSKVFVKHSNDTWTKIYPLPVEPVDSP